MKAQSLLFIKNNLYKVIFPFLFIWTFFLPEGAAITIKNLKILNSEPIEIECGDSVTIRVTFEYNYRANEHHLLKKPLKFELRENDQPIAGIMTDDILDSLLYSMQNNPARSGKDTIEFNLKCIAYPTADCKCKLTGAIGQDDDAIVKHEIYVRVSHDGRQLKISNKVNTYCTKNGKRISFEPDQEYYTINQEGFINLEFDQNIPNVLELNLEIFFNPETIEILAVIFNDEVYSEFSFAEVSIGTGSIEMYAGGSTSPGTVPQTIGQIHFKVKESTLPGAYPFEFGTGTHFLDNMFEPIPLNLGKKPITVYPLDIEPPSINLDLLDINKNSIQGAAGAVGDDNLGILPVELEIFIGDNISFGLAEVEADGSFNFDDLPLYEGEPIRIVVRDATGKVVEENVVTPMELTFALLNIQLMKMLYPKLGDDPKRLRVLMEVENPTDHTFKFINILMKYFNGEDYAWMVQNIPIPPSGEIVIQEVNINFRELGNLTEGSIIEITPLISNVPIHEAPPLTQSTNILSVGSIEVNLSSNPVINIDLSNYIADDLYFLPETTFDWTALNFDSICYEYRGEEMPNIDLDSCMYSPFQEDPFYPDYAGDWNACAPAGVANSFSWLRKKHPEINTILQEEFGDNDEEGQHALLRELSELMYRKDTMGVMPDSIAMGKIALVDKYKLPMHVKFQSWLIPEGDIDSPNPAYNHKAKNLSESPGPARPNAKISMDWVLKEMKKGEDVEIDYVCLDVDSLGQPVLDEDGHVKYTHAHCITLADIFKVGDFWSLGFKDDLNQGNLNFFDLRYGRTPVTQEPDDAHADLRGMYSLPNVEAGRCYIRSVFSESYDETVDFTVSTDQADYKSFFAVQLLGNPVVQGSSAKLQISLDKSTEVEVRLYNLNGHLIQKAFKGELFGGKTIIEISTTNLTTGTYFVQTKNSDSQVTEKLVVVK